MRAALTVKQALELPVLRAGAPEVLAGADDLERPVRWVHVVESRRIGSVLRGGELLISEGRMLAKEADDRSFIAELAEREIAGLILELGDHLQSVPRHVVDECRSRRIPLVALHVEVAFIDVTEAIHRQLVANELTLLESSRRLQDKLTAMILEGEGVSEVLEAVATAIGNPVVYEHEHGGIVYQASAGASEQEILAGWRSFGRGLGTAPEVAVSPVMIGAKPRGRLVVLALNRGLNDEDRGSLERAAVTVSLVLMRDQHQDVMATRAQRGLLSGMVRGEVPPFLAESRAAKNGFEPQVLLPLVVGMGRHHRSRPVSLEDEMWRQTWDDATATWRNRHLPFLVDQGSSTSSTLLLVGLDDEQQRDAAADRLASVLSTAAAKYIDDRTSPVICVGPAVRTWHAAAAGLQAALDALEGAMHTPARPWHDATDLDLDRLLWSLRDNRELERFARLRLEKLVDHDRRKQSQLLTTLKVLLDQNGQKAETARILHLERQSLYNRVEKIESLLGADLDDSDVRLGLHIAVRALRYLEGEAPERPVEGS